MSGWFIIRYFFPVNVTQENKETKSIPEEPLYHNDEFVAIMEVRTYVCVCVIIIGFLSTAAV